MSKTLRLLSPLLLGSALLIPSGTGVLAAHTPMAVGRTVHVKVDHLGIFIPTSYGTVWGRVTASYTYAHRFHLATSMGSNLQLQVPQGTWVHLSEVPTNGYTWPFSEWQVNSAGRNSYIMSLSANIRITGYITVSALY